jgi:hypothetical protein
VLRGPKLPSTAQSKRGTVCSCWPAKTGNHRLSWLPSPQEGKIQWDPAAAAPQAAEPGGASAYDTLAHRRLPTLDG